MVKQIYLSYNNTVQIRVHILQLLNKDIKP